MAVPGARSRLANISQEPVRFLIFPRPYTQKSPPHKPQLDAHGSVCPSPTAVVPPAGTSIARLNGFAYVSEAHARWR